MKEQFKLESLLLEEKKKALREFIHGHAECVRKLQSAGFTRVFQSLLMRCRVFCNLADTGWRQNKSGNYDINGQNKLPNIAIQVKGGGESGVETCVISDKVQAFLRKEKTKEAQ